MRALLFIFTIAWAVSLAWADAPTSTPTTEPTVDEQVPAYSNTKRVEEEWLGDKPRQVIILPTEPQAAGELMAERSGGVVAKLSSERHLLPEGYVIGARPAHIERKGDWYLAHLVPQEGMPDTPPLRLLPNQNLAMIETVLTETSTTPKFLLTGRVTEFEGANYLLIEHVAELLPPIERPVDAQPTSTPAAPSPAGVKKPIATEPTSEREPSAEEIIQQLMKSNPARAMVIPQTPEQISTSTDDATEEKKGQESSLSNISTRWPEATLLIDRQGRLLAKSDNWWSLAFEDRGRKGSQKPIHLLPNRLLETAISLAGGGRQGVVFIISGEVTVYKQDNYLLLRKVLLQRDLGNLR